MTITEFLRVEDVHLNFRARSVVDAIPLLLGPALEHHVSDASRHEILAAVMRRELETATLCGTLSLPHARHELVKHFVVSAGINPAGVIEGKAEPRIMFAFVSPEKKREEHLHFLASLARLSQNRQLIDQIAGAADAEQVLAALRTAGL